MYPDLTDMSAPAHALAIRNDIDVRQYIYSQFEKRAANVTNSGKKSWEKLDKKTLKFHIFEDQRPHVKREDDVKSLQNDLEEWRAAHANLEAEKNNLIREMQSTISNMASEIKGLKKTNSQLEEYIKCLEKEEGFAYWGKHISDTKKKQRTLKAFLSRAQTALWFPRILALSSSH